MRQILIFAVAALIVGGAMPRAIADKAVVEAPDAQAAAVQPSSTAEQSSAGQHRMVLTSDRDGHFRVEPGSTAAISTSWSIPAPRW